MELHKLKREELKGYDEAKLRETAKDIRQQLHSLRMDIYASQGKNTAKVASLKRNLARALTFQRLKAVGLSGDGTAGKKVSSQKSVTPKN